MKIKNVKRIMILLLIIIMILSLKSFAETTGSFSTSISSKELNQEESVNVSITTTNCAGAFTISSSDSSIASVNRSSVWIDGTETFTITTKNAGTAIISITATDVGDNQTPSEEVTGTKTVTITVNAKQQSPTNEETPSNPTSQPEPDSQQPTTPTVTEPNFTSVNRTMYATGDINLRDSWSTSSKATPIEKNTELTVTGTSTDRVNNYIWYRVSYKGQTKYVSSSLITSTKPEENEEEKANANLKSLSVKGFSLSPTFSKDILEYTLQVQMDTEKLEINTETENEKATVKVQGNETLAEGENIVKIIVTAEDGKNTKTYTIKVNKEEEIFGLQSLIIKDTDIADLFQTDVYEYQIEIGDIDELEIEAIATNEDATIEILGNEELVEGENIITIIVKSKDEEKTVTYQIKANKKIVIEEPIQEKSINTKYIVFGVIGGVILITLIIVVIYIIKHRKQSSYYEDEEYNNEEYYPEELPKKVENYNNFNTENYEEEDNNGENYEDNEEETNIEEYEDEEDNIEDYDDEEIKRRKGKHF